MDNTDFKKNKIVKIVRNRTGIQEMYRNTIAQMQDWDGYANNCRLLMYDNQRMNLYFSDLEPATKEEAESFAKQQQEIEKKIFENVDVAKAIMAVVYPGESEHKWNSGRRCHEYTIHFPEITCSNSNEKEHTMRDIFITLSFTEKMLFQDMLARRTTFSLIEYQKGFCHPHIGTGCENAHQFKSTCMGESPVRTISNELRLKFDKDMFEALLISVKDWIKWESLEGGPYIKTSDLGGIRESGSPGSSYSEGIYKKFLAIVDSFPLTFVGDTDKNRYEVPKNDDFEKLCLLSLEKTFDKNNDSYRRSLYSVKIDGRFYEGIGHSPSSNLESYNKSFREHGKFLDFNGKRYYMQLVNDPKFQSDANLVCNPAIVNYIKNRLEKEVNEAEYQSLIAA